MSRRVFVSFAVTLLAVGWLPLVLVQSPEPPTTPEDTSDVTGAPGGVTTATNNGDGKGNDSKGEEMWLKWNDTGMGENDTSWLVKFCPRDLTKAFEKICQMHCWWNGWQGGICTEDNNCVCLWKSAILDVESTGIKQSSVSRNIEKSPGGILAPSGAHIPSRNTAASGGTSATQRAVIDPANMKISMRNTSWLVKYCPRELTTAFENICQMHCWWNGWQGGYCTVDSVCVCQWEGVVLDKESTGSKHLTLPRIGGNATGAGGASAGSGGEPPAGGESTTTEGTTTPEPANPA